MKRVKEDEIFFSLLMQRCTDTQPQKVNPNKRRPDGDSTIIERAATAAKKYVKKLAQHGKAAVIVRT